MLVFPQPDPVAFHLGPLQVHWYGLMYLLGFMGAWILARWRVNHYHLAWTKIEISDLIFFAALGAVIGGRIGYMLFYDISGLMAEPLLLFQLWKGGMSFHGGLVGVGLALFLFARKTGKTFLHVTDFMAPLAPFGLGAGRAGNFINGELWGRASDVPWAMVFPQAGPEGRHPSQLYELGLEGIILFIAVWVYARKPRPAGCVSAIFLIAYALCRLLAECFREPDVQLGFLAFDWLTMGQLLSLPMLVGGIILWWIKRNEDLPPTR
jgi:phosphatidylglycerol:prolipoprotein diacylglycerol transferase